MGKVEDWKILVTLLRKISEAKGLSQQDIADKSGLHRSNINRMFQLQYCPNLNTFIKVAKAIKVNFFFADIDDTTDIDKLFESAMTELGRRPDRLPQN